jgi:hypothetical protein
MTLLETCGLLATVVVCTACFVVCMYMMAWFVCKVAKPLYCPHCGVKLTSFDGNIESS